MFNKYSKIMLVVSVAAFLLAMPLVGFHERSVSGSGSGFDADPAPRAWLLLAIGPLGLLGGYWEWLANPLLFLGWFFLMFGRTKRATLVSVAALLAISAFLLRREITWYGDNGNSTYQIVGEGLGYWLWLLSAVSLCAATIRKLVVPRFLKFDAGEAGE